MMKRALSLVILSFALFAALSSSAPGPFQEFANETNQTIIPPSISPSVLSPPCLIQGSSATISAFINGSIQSVIFSSNINGSWQNTTLSGNFTGNYQKTLSSSALTNPGTIHWQFIVIDTLNGITFGPLESSQVHQKTTLDSNPSTPNGLNGWYISPPSFTLSNPDASRIFYKWDSQAITQYSGGFGIEGAPNNAIITGGILDLNYWSNVCAPQNLQNESTQTKVIKADFTQPLITSLVPADNSVVVSQNVLISALLDEVYQGNSGINASSIVFMLDDSQVAPNKTQLGIDVQVSYLAKNLSIGKHHILLSVSDKAGLSSQRNWSFQVTGLPQFSLTLMSPENKLYETRRVQVNLTTSREAAEIQYINHNDGDRGFRRLCRNCGEYGNSRKKVITMVEGLNNLTFRAIGFLGEVDEESVSFLVDTKIPQITKTLPKKGFSSGIFSVEFIEENPSQLYLFLEGINETKNISLELEDCQALDGKKVCEIGADLSDFEGQEVNYWFYIKDLLGNSAQSNKVKLNVDTISPVVTSFGNNILSNGRVFFQIGIQDENFDRILYIDQTEVRPRERTICTRLDANSLCQKTISFSRGQHTIDIFAIDGAGNGVQVADDLQLSL